MTDALLSVDPGKSSGWAYWCPCAPWQLVVYGRLLGADVVDISSLLGRLQPDGWVGCHVVVEGQWYRPGNNGSPFGDVVKIIESRCAWADAALLAGAETSVAPPGQWIKQMTSGAPGATPDDRIRYRVRQQYTHLKVVQDENPAILLGDWWLTRHHHRIHRDHASMRWMPEQSKNLRLEGQCTT